MGIFNYIKERLNPEIVKLYNDLLDNNSEAVLLYCQGGYKDSSRKMWNPKNEGFPKPNKGIPFEWKQRLVKDSAKIQNWYLEEMEYRKGCSYSRSHPYGLTMALRKLSVMPKDAPIPYLPEWEEIGGDAPFSPTDRRPVVSPYRNVPFYSIEGRIYKYVNWQQVEQWETDARNLLKRIDHISKWRKEQSDFAPRCYSLMKEKLSTWGCYFYDIPFPSADENETDSVNVRQLFYRSYCADTKLDYRHYSHCAQNRKTVSEFLRMDSFYTNKYVRPLIDYILALDKKVNEGLTIVLGDSSVKDGKQFNEFHLKDFVHEAEENGLPIVQIDDINNNIGNVPVGKVLAVVEVITENTHLKDVCSKLFKSCYEQASLIVYITLLKEFSSDEMRSLIDVRNKEVEELERKKKAEEEKRRKEEEERKKKEEELRAKRMILSAAESKDWPMVKGVHHYFFYYYYPTRFEDVTEFDWDVRNLIWDFKDGTRHDKVCQILTNKLCRVYGEAIDLLTFVCIPASTRDVNRDRYQSFMVDVCNATGMANGYDYVTIVKEKEPTRLGGEFSAEYSYDKDFFKDRQIILFDDVVTRGRSLAKMRIELENLGAHIVAALSIGRTYSDYYGDVREPHPWIIENKN